MFSAQQHPSFGYSPLQHTSHLDAFEESDTKSNSDAFSAGLTAGNWNDDQEQFLRNLLTADPLDASPASNSGVASSHASQSPPFFNNSTTSGSDDAGRSSSLSPVSSNGNMSLHEFIHNGSASGSISGNSTNGGLQTPTDVQGPSIAQQMPLGQMPMPREADAATAAQQQQHMLDARTVDIFVKMMSSMNDNGNGNNSLNDGQFSGMPAQEMHPMIAQQMQMSMNEGYMPQNGMAPDMMQHMLQLQHQHQHQHQHQQAQHAQPANRQFASSHRPFEFHAPQTNNGFPTMPFPVDHFQGQPTMDTRKRSAPEMASAFVEPHVPTAVSPNQQPVAKKTRTRKSDKGLDAPPPSVQTQNSMTPRAAMDNSMFFNQNTNSFIPRMEVGSNATALAALERLKAKKRLAVEQEIEASKRAAAEEATKAIARDSSGAIKGKAGSSSSKATNSAASAHKHEKKVAHNAIERRYRVNINSRIAALRNSVPALRELRPPRKQPGKGKAPLPEDLVDGVPAATKLNKATILGKATEYIRYLKGRETRLVSEVAGLQELICSLEGGGELLELWQGEMERVVAEQEAMAKAALAMEDDSYDIAGEDEEDDDDEDDDEDDKKNARASPTSDSSTSKSRYMMGIFMGFSILGGGAEVMSAEHATRSATEHAHHVLRASSGRVIGASHQLLKRGMQATNVSLGTLARDPHHYDHVANHLLVVEVVRGLALVACLAFIFWPWIAKFAFGRLPMTKGRRRNNGSAYTSRTRIATPRHDDEIEYTLRRKEMLATLANPNSTPHQTDHALRHFLHAPSGALSGVVRLPTLALRQLVFRLGVFNRTVSVHEEEQAATWCRLLELETSMGALAQRSLFARMHTLFTVMSLPAVGFGTQSKLTMLEPARVYGTIAIAAVRLSNGIALLNPFAERYWTKARRCRLLAADDAFDNNDIATSMSLPTASSSDRWLDPVLELDVLDAFALCPAPTSVASTFTPQCDAWTRATMISPLLNVAANQHNRHLASIWTTLLCQIVQTTCPSSLDTSADETNGDRNGSSNRSQSCAAFVKHHAESHIDLPLLSHTEDRDRLTSQIARLTLTAPRCPRVQIMCNVTFGAWALLMGNASVARGVAAALIRISRNGTVRMPASAIAFVSLVFGKHEAVAMASTSPEHKPATNGGSTSNKANYTAAFNEVDALAAASLSWLDFLRTLSVHLKQQPQQAPKDTTSLIATSAVAIRRLLASARAVRPLGIDDVLTYAAPGLSGTDEDHMLRHRDSLASSTSSTPSTLLADDFASAGAASTAQAALVQARIAQRNLDDSLDTLTDILAMLGRKAAMGQEAFSKESLLRDTSDPTDSGVEWTVAS